MIIEIEQLAAALDSAAAGGERPTTSRSELETTAAKVLRQQMETIEQLRSDVNTAQVRASTLRAELDVRVDQVLVAQQDAMADQNAAAEYRVGLMELAARGCALELTGDTDVDRGVETLRDRAAAWLAIATKSPQRLADDTQLDTSA